MNKHQGIWVSPTEFVNFAEDRKPLSQQIATRQRSMAGFYGLGKLLPNPDPVLKAAGKDIATYRNMRTNARIGGALRQRKAAVLALERGLDRGKSKSRVAKNVESMLADLDLDRIIGEMLDAPYFGYQPLEVMWTRVAGRDVPADVVGKPPEWFTYDQDNRLRFRSREHPLYGEELRERKFLVARQDASYDNPYGFPDASMCFWPDTFIKGGLKFWLFFTEKYGMPFLVGKTPRGTQDKESDTLADQLEQMIQDAIAVIPDDSSVEIMEAAGKAASADIYERLVRYCGSDINIALKGQDQTTEASANRASALAGQDVTHDIRDAHASIAAGQVNLLIRWFCDLNYGGGDYPVWSMWEQEEVDEVRATRDEKLSRSGARLTPAYYKRAYGLEDGDLDETAMSHRPAEQPGPAEFAEGGVPPADEIDALVAQETAQWQPLLSPLYAPVQTLLDQAAREGLTADELIERLAQELARMDADPMTQALTAALFAARAAGETGDDQDGGIGREPEAPARRRGGDGRAA